MSLIYAAGLGRRRVPGGVRSVSKSKRKPLKQ